jgi:hypothetical protein
MSIHVSNGSSTHHQEHKTVHTASGITKQILLLAAIVDGMALKNTLWKQNLRGDITGCKAVG